ncbi:DUF1273 domain-containing protein [Streptococcus sp. sy004]|uniref:DUF1273 domain-containing protein n=1 Tax=Streptococcus sp. sy004 TaxID=2600149 RepID=UPI0011B7FDB6|nr:DUF1273 domain-containing protein [Streptococcus sp. sy004]TWT10352.1 DUF1273 domain-containing protein [Streptococcus sp. sy004]
MSTILVSGYRNFDLGIFQETDPRLQVIKKAIEKDLEHLCEQGLEWLIFTGNLGFEYWVLEVAKNMQKDYRFQMGVIFPFEDHGQSWNDSNQMILAAFKALDFVKYSYPSYQNPSQLKHYQDFLLNHTDGAYLFYDEERETNLKYLFRQMKSLPNYDIKRLDFDRLNDLAQEIES